MKQTFSRRTGLKMAGTGALMSVAGGTDFLQAATAGEMVPLERWTNAHDRVFLGGEVWANPMEDWAIVDGWAESQNRGGNRNIHSLTHQLVNPKAGFELSVEVDHKEEAKGALAGFRIGVRSELNEFRSNVFAAGGLFAGLSTKELVLGRKKQTFVAPVELNAVNLHLKAEDTNGKFVLTLTASDSEGEVLGHVTSNPEPESLLGNIALVSNYQAKAGRSGGKAFRFRSWKAGGEAFAATPENQFGPLLWSMYSLSDSRGDEGFVLKISALTGPMGAEDNHVVELHVEKDGEWQSLGEAKLHPDAWTATFRIPNWDETKETPYKLVYLEKGKDGAEVPSEWGGKILANPKGRPLRLAALTCQNDYGFPYEPVAENVVKLEPDMVYFSGDQIYESHGGFGIIREPAEPAILNYLRKFYQFGWSFRESMKDAPTICLPDDHDVFQGNIWGEGGAPMKNKDKGASSKGGYREPARMVNAVHITNCGHHPDYYDPTPVLQDISVYYGDMVYGDVSFAIIADRQWKSGPNEVETGSGRADHVRDMDFDTSVLDKPGLVLLGERQEAFLKAWGQDWRGHTMKVLLSQTVFAAVATHHGRKEGGELLKGDLDSGGWPQTPRNRAIEILRESKALHINGDQHLTTLTQYGVDQQRDSNWAFCTPAIAAGYPRSWRPDDVEIPHENRPEHGLPNTGEYLDGFGNKAYVYAVGNPVIGVDPNRYKKAHEKGSGFGMVTIDTAAKTYSLEAFKFLIDATDGKPENQFPGWPVTIHQAENGGENVLR